MGIEETWDFAMGAVTRALGDDVTWKPGTAEETSLKAVYGEGFDRVASGTVRVSSTRPEIMVRASDLPSEPARGDEVSVRGTTYVVSTIEQDVEAVSYNLVLKRSS